jgi:uncharacterized Zn-finger protein
MQLETITVNSETIYCDGSSKDAGHPRVFLPLKDGVAKCPYCGRMFALAPGKKTGSGH